MLSNFFSSEFINKKAAKNNIIIYLLGRLAYPFAFILVKIGFSPNQITTLSTVFAVFAFLSLVLDSSGAWFIVCWSISLLLDFCDGTAARMTGRVRSTAFRYDHTSDLFKISIIILGVAIKFDNTWVWVTALTSVFFFMYYMLLNHDASWASQVNSILKSKADEAQVNINHNKIKRFTLKEKIKNKFREGLIKDMLYNMYTIVTSIDGHTLLIFLLFSLNVYVVMSVLMYFTFLSFIGVWRNINRLKSIEKV